ncbi:unnamed protein product [Chrysoparadoxa australica]
MEKEREIEGRSAPNTPTAGSTVIKTGRWDWLWLPRALGGRGENSSLSRGQQTVVSHAKPSERLHTAYKSLSQSLEGRWTGAKPKARTLLLFAAMQLTAWLSLIPLTALVKWCMKAMYAEGVENQLRVLDAIYSVKVDQIGFLHSNMARYDAVKDLLRGDSSQAALVADLLQEDLKAHISEISTLLDADKRVVVSSNADRTGEIFDPSGVVSSMEQNLGLQQWKASTLFSYEEFLLESPPHWYERGHVSNPAIVPPHPYESKDPGLFRFIVTPVWEGDEGGEGALLGYIVGGDLVSGKLGIPARFFHLVYGVTDATPGDTLTAAFTEANVAEDNTRWQLVTAAFNMHERIFDGRVMSVGIQSHTEELSHLADAVVETRNANEHRSSFDARRSMVYVGEVAPSFSEHLDGVVGVGEKRWRAVLLSGARATELINFSQYLVFSEVIIVLIQLSVLALVLIIFMSPLEKMGKSTKEKKRVSMAVLGRLPRRKRLLVPIIASSGLSMVVVIMAALGFEGMLRELALKLSTKASAAVALSYELKLDRMRLTSAAAAVLPDVREIAGGSLDDAHFTNARAAMLKELTQLKIEFVSLVSADGKVLISSNNPARRGEAWDPLQIVSAVVDNNASVEKSGVLDHTEAIREMTPRHIERLHDSTPLPTLFPEHHDVARVLGLPVYAPGNTAAKLPDAVLVAIDLANGKTLTCEQANDILHGDAYSAIYMYTEEGGYEVISGIYTKGIDTKVDVKVPEANLGKMFDSIRKDPRHISNTVFRFQREQFSMTARCVQPTVLHSADLIDSFEYVHEEGCSIFLVTGIPAHVTRRANIYLDLWLSYWLIMQTIRYLACMVIAWQAFQPFRKIMKNPVIKSCIKRQETEILSAKLASSNPGSGRSPVTSLSPSRYVT